MKQILLGTRNRNKVNEISKILSDLPLKVKTLFDFPKVPLAIEDGETLEENAVKKAEYYSKATGLFTLADDTGLEVKSLNNEPGVLSARYAGEHCSYADNNRKLLEKLRGTNGSKRSARFRCVIACYDHDTKRAQTVEGSIEGEILDSARGENGFGYDPIFYLPKLKKTLAELYPEEKNKLSHRALALLKVKKLIGAVDRL